MKKLVFMASGSGTNFENLVKAIRAGQITAEAALLVCDKPGAGCLERAKRLGVPTEIVDRKAFDSKAAFEERIGELLDGVPADWIILAGFMRVLSAEFVTRYWGRIINIHPSLLPKFPGASAIRDAFEAKVSETGVTTHFVTPEVDAGPIILQKKVPVTPSDNLDTLEARVHAAEYEIYPETLRLLLSGKVKPPAPLI